MSELIDAITGLSPAQLELLKQHLEKLKPATGSSTTARIRPRDRSESDPIPLSLAQQGYWFQEQLDPTRTRSNLTAAVRIDGLFDANALARAVNEIVRRHETLRTTFKLVEGQPAQFVSSTQTTKLQLLDLSHLPDAEREAEALQLAAAEPLRHFELAKESLLRATLVKLRSDAHVLLLTIHHIICDRWSQGLLIGELLTLYQAFAADQPSSLPDLPVQYPDFALWQHDWLQSEEMKKQLSYWKKQLDGAPVVLDIPTDRPRTPGVRGKSRKFRFTVSRELMEKIKKLSRDEDTTLFVVLLATLNTLLYRYTAQPDIVVGSVIANRNRPEIVNLIGLFANTVLLRTKLAGDLSFRGLLKQVAEMSLDSQTYQDLPFEKLAQELQTEGTGVPRFQVVFNLQKSPAPFRPLPGLTLSQIDVSQELASFDLFWLLEETDDGLSGLLEYNSALFDDSTIDQFSEAFIQILQTAVQQPDTLLSAFALPHDLEAKRLAARMREQQQTIAVSATFTAEPLEQALNFWMQELDTPSHVTFAPHNQVFQQLLLPGSLLSTNERGINVLLVRLEDWQGFEEDGDWTGAKENIERNVNDFAGALAGATQRNSVPYLVCLCSASPSILNDPERESFFRRMQGLLASKLAEIKQVYVVSPNEIDTLYPVSDYFDAVRNKLGHVSYTPVFFTALGTMIARKIHAIQSRPYKCVVTDCDQTLWKGVSAEDGIAGIEVDAARRELQEFLVARHEAGMLICVCSKNNERDVVEVFEQGRGMVLRRDQVVSWRINWESKSDNIRSLARELNLGLDSFIFIDDNPVECAEVAANCPGVLSLQLPSDAAAIPKFLKHVWAFDQLQTTEEDRQRTTLYKQNREREQFRQESLSLETFFAGLGLQIQISETDADEIERVSQLTWRTNQFNTTSIRRSENEVRELLQSNDWSCLSVRVKDRFGDYGLVGAIMFKEASESLYVDTFLLSCRALGKGVEHRMLAELGRIALARELSRVDIPCGRTERNQPVRDFLESVAGESDVYRLPATVAAACTFKPSQVAEPHESRIEGNARPAARAESGLMSRIANELSDPEEVTRLIASRSLRARNEVEVVYTAPSTPVEEMLADIWTSILNLDSVGTKDNFFKIGGHSLLGTLLISRIRDNFQVELPLLVLFERPTIAGLAEVIEQDLIKQVDSGLMAEMMEGLDQLTDEEVKALLTDETSQLARARSAD